MKFWIQSEGFEFWEEDSSYLQPRKEEAYTQLTAIFICTSITTSGLEKDDKTTPHSNFHMYLYVWWS